MLRKITIEKIEKEGGRGDGGRSFVVFMTLHGDETDAKGIEKISNIPLGQVNNILAHNPNTTKVDVVKTLIIQAAKEWYVLKAGGAEEKAIIYGKADIIKFLGSDEILVT